MQLVDEFKLRYPQFSEISDSLISIYLHDAKTEVSAPRWGKLYKRGLFALVAHFLKLRELSDINEGYAAKNVVSESAGGLSVTYGQVSADGSLADYHLTAYGKEYMRLLALVGIGVLVVGACYR